MDQDAEEDTDPEDNIGTGRGHEYHQMVMDSGAVVAHKKSGLHTLNTFGMAPPRVDANARFMPWPEYVVKVHVQFQADNFCDCVHFLLSGMTDKHGTLHTAIYRTFGGDGKIRTELLSAREQHHPSRPSGRAKKEVREQWVRQFHNEGQSVLGSCVTRAHGPCCKADRQGGGTDFALFVLAHVLCRPVIVYGTSQQGIYLPLCFNTVTVEVEVSRAPVLLLTEFHGADGGDGNGSAQGWFNALVPNCPSIPQEHVGVPLAQLVCGEWQELPIRFAPRLKTQKARHALLEKYLSVKKMSNVELCLLPCG